jgi:hypothetical protein
MKERNYCTKTWRQHALNPNVADRSAVDWIFVVDTLNFSFWSETNKSKDSNKSPFYVEHKGVRYTGYWALPAAINNGD